VLNQLIEELFSYNDLFNFTRTYSKSLCTILEGISSKLVSCDTRIQLSKERDYNSNGYVLTRDGIKELFGYQGTKARTPHGCNYYKRLAANNSVISSLIRLIGSPAIQKSEALKKCIKFLLEISPLEDQGSYSSLLLTEEYTLQMHPDSGDTYRFSCLECYVTQRWGETGVYLTNSNEIRPVNTYSSTIPKYEAVVKVTDIMNTVDYLQVSEEPVYSLLCTFIRENINKCKEQAAITDKNYQTILERYGEYLVVGTL
jgi:hypothetical protein